MPSLLTILIFPRMAKILILFACCLPASAQGRWVDDLFLVQDKMFRTAIYLIDENNVIRKKIPSVIYSMDENNAIIKVIPSDDRNNVVIIEETPADTSISKPPTSINLNRADYGSAWYNDALYTLVFSRGDALKDADGKPIGRFIFAKYQDGEWRYLGSFDTPHTSMTSHIIPCDNDRFIFISSKVGMGGSTGLDITPFTRMALNSEKKEVSLTSSIDHGQDELREHMSNEGCFSQAYRSEIIMTDGYATLLNFRTGLYWVFSQESASLRRAGNIFKKVTPDMIAKNGFTDAILCAHPEKEGTILISAQVEESFTTQPDYQTEMMEQWKLRGLGQHGATEAMHKEWWDLYQKRDKQVKEQNPQIVWYRLHPESGKVEKIVPPEGAAFDRDGGKNDSWRPMPDGSVKMGSVKMKAQEEKAPEKQEVKAPDKQP